jgi:hypothetical protein
MVRRKKAGMKPGSIAKASGQARVKGRKGEVTVVKGKRVPPHGKGKGQRVKITDYTKHARKKKTRK